MKKLVLSLCSLASVIVVSAQFSVGVAGNYTVYKGSVQRNTPGFGARVVYEPQDKYGAILSYTHGMPIKTPSSTMLMGSNASDMKSVSSDEQLNFKTINLLGQYTFVGNEESAGKFYGLVGGGFVLVSYKESITENYDKSAYEPMHEMSGSESGFTMNFGLGGQFKLGVPVLFAEGTIAIPANKVNEVYVDNYIPGHFTFNVGLKLPLGGGN